MRISLGTSRVQTNLFKHRCNILLAGLYILHLMGFRPFANDVAN